MECLKWVFSLKDQSGVSGNGHTYEGNGDGQTDSEVAVLEAKCLFPPLGKHCLGKG
jgi:hypothetical protein